MADRRIRSYEMAEIVHRGLADYLTKAFTIATDECDGVFLLVDINVCDPGYAPGTGAQRPLRPPAARRGAPDLPEYLFPSLE